MPSPTSIKLDDWHLERVQQLIQEKKFLNRSECIRHALTFYLDFEYSFFKKIFEALELMGKFDAEGDKITLTKAQLEYLMRNGTKHGEE